MDALEIRLLGPLRVLSPAAGDLTPNGRRAQALLAMIALSEHGERSRAWLQSKLWSDRPPAQASASLRQELSQLRRLVGAEHLVTEADRVALRHVRVDVLEIIQSEATAAGFVAAEVPDLLEGLEIRDEAFEDWLRAERSHWHEQLEDLAGRARTSIAGEPVRRPAPVAAPPGFGEGLPAPMRSPTLGILPCVIHSENPHLSAVGDLLCDLVSKLLLENGSYGVFDFRDLKGEFSQDFSGKGNPLHGPDLLLSIRVTEVTSMLEIAFGVRRVEDGRLIWTQSYASDPTDRALFTGERVSVFVNQAIEAVEQWFLKNSEDERRCASRLTLAAAHQAFGLRTNDLKAAEQQLNTALELDFSAVRLGWLALLECFRHGERLEDSPKETIERVRAHTARALEIDRGNSLALALLGHANAFVDRNFSLADELIGEALQINPHRAANWDARAMLSIYSGDVEEGYRAALRAKSLGRYSPYAFWYEASCGIGAALCGRHEDAIRHGRLVLAQRPDFQPTLRHQIASLALSGQTDEAREMHEHLRRLEPDFSIGRLRASGYPTPNAQSIELLETGLRKAGVAIEAQ